MSEESVIFNLSPLSQTQTLWATNAVILPLMSESDCPALVLMMDRLQAVVHELVCVWRALSERKGRTEGVIYTWEGSLELSASGSSTMLKPEKKNDKKALF